MNLLPKVLHAHPMARDRAVTKRQIPWFDVCLVLPVFLLSALLVSRPFKDEPEHDVQETS